MAPTPQEHAVTERAVDTDFGNRVVITGMSGLFPQSKNVKELADILYNKVNPVTDENCRWEFDHPEVANHTGKVPQLDRFDGQFFKVHFRLGNSMDSMGRKILEQAYQAIYDAGISPEHLSGKKVGVYTGSCFSETEKACFYVASSRTGFGIAGCSKTMFANRISYWLNAKGPSMSIDDACCSSIAALELAYLAIARGECEAAIVGGANLCLHPQSSVHYGRIMTLCKDGKTKSFDQNADGCAKSEAINVLFLQRAKYAKRIYAEVKYVKTEFTEIFKNETGQPKYGFYRDPMVSARFLKDFYDEAKVPPQSVEYVEAFGSAVPEADKAELESLDAVFCNNRTAPLLVGSVMSNIGYGEAASGISAVTKVLLGYHTGVLAGNLHCSQPRQDVSGLREGRMKVLTDHHGFTRALTAVNGISVTGVNAHVLLHGHYKPKDLERYMSAMPRLVNISGRQDTSVSLILEDLKSRPIDPEEIGLLHNIHETRISGHLGRGYIILDTNDEGKTVSLAEKTSYFDDVKRPLWFVYSGMGSQWAGMGTQLMRIPIFAAAIERCRKALEPKGIDIVHILTSPDKTIFDNILNSFVGIAAVQIGLTDVLNALGIVPDNIIGHSVGELGCAYADGCFTAEEMILSAYSRGLVSVQTPFIKGSMAAVGVGFQQISKLIPPEIEVACHNGPDSSTISGPADIMKQFVATLTEQGIFAKEVPCSNIAYHSRYIAEAGPGLLKYLSEVITSPKARSDRWVSTSVPEDRWNEPLAKYSSAEYHTNNLLNSVLFEETSMRHIPANAVLVEIAPHGLLQAILKRSLPESCKHIPLTRRGHSDNVLMVLDAIGKLYMEGYNPKVQAIYPQIEFPVSTGTPMLSHLVEWAHGEKWNLPLYVSAHRKMAAACKYFISVHDEENSYLRGHVIRGKTLFPFSAALVAVWDTLVMSLLGTRKQMSVEFRNIHLYAQPVLQDQRHLRLSVALHRGTGRFEVLDENRKIATGYITPSDSRDKRDIFNSLIESKETLDLNSEDVYQMLHERDYFYRGEFRSIHKVNASLTQGQIEWKNNWVTFLDGILQLNALKHGHDTVSYPCQIREILIDVKEHGNKKAVDVDGKTVMMADIVEVHDLTRCGGVIIENLKFRKMPMSVEDKIALKTLKFVPRMQSKVDLSSALYVYLQAVAENVNKETINVLRITGDDVLDAFDEIHNILDDIPGVKVDYEQVNRDNVLAMRDYFLTDVDLVLVQNLSQDDTLCQLLYRVLRRDTFLINAEETIEERIRPSALYRVIAANNSTKTKLVLVKWRPTQIAAASSVITVRSRSELSLLAATRSDLPARHKLIVLSSYPPRPGLKDAVKKWRKEPERNQIYLVMVSDSDSLDQLPDLDLAFNVLRHGVWGGEYYTPCAEEVPAERGIALRSSMIGDLDALHWVEAPEIEPGLPVTVHYAAISDYDVKRANGVIPFKHTDDDISFAMDFSGVTDKGERVMGVLPSGAASSFVSARPELTWPVPSHWTLEDAVTVPSAYMHAFYCLAIKCELLSSHNVLVHGGAGALGQAAIAVALGQGCEVFATVSDIRKKRFLMRLFPELKDDHIGNSRDGSFVDMVKLATDGVGCKVVISCVQGGLKDVSLTSVSYCGMTLDTVQLPIQENFDFGMYHLTMERHYLPVDFTSIFANNNIENIKKLQILISDGIARGYVRPLSRVTYPTSEVSRAFRLLSASRHRGRVALRLRDSVGVAQPRLSCSPDLCHLILCDEGAFGLQLAERLISRGAKKLRLHSSRPSAHLRLKIKSWANLGVKAEVSSEELNSKGVVGLLTDSSRLGPVEGIYVVATDISESTVDKLTIVVHILDLTSRKMCPSVRNFVVVSAGEVVGHNTCLSRTKDGLPATCLSLSALKNVGDSESSLNHTALSWRSAVEATERAVRSKQPALLAHAQKRPRLTLLQQIAALADIEISEETSDLVTLAELGIELVKVPAICSYLRDVHQVALSEDQVRCMTVEKLRELEHIIQDSGFEEVQGLSSFISYVDPDELLATTEIVFLPTVTNSATMRDEEFDISQKYLCIVPGLEGHHERFRVLCERLKLPALVLQPGLDALHETPRDTAERYAKVLLKKTEIKSNFYLLGYESGVIVALEIAEILEDHGLIGTVFCVGGTPEEFQETLEEELKDFETEEALQDKVARHMFSLMAGNTIGLDEALKNASTWEEKIAACVRTLLGRVPHSAQYAKTLIEAAYKRIVQARKYKIQPRPLKSKLILLHVSSLSRGNSSSITSNYLETSPTTLMQQYSQQPVVTVELQAPLAHCAKDLRCAAVINKNLDSDLLNAFDQKNLCETYLMNADTFMMNAAIDV